MKFMITFTHIDGEWERLSPEGREGLREWHAGFEAALAAEQGTALVYFARPEEARTVRLRGGGDFVVNDGPYIRGIEHAGGYYVVDVASLDEALEWARRGRYMPGACEVRQLVQPRI